MHRAAFLLLVLAIRNLHFFIGEALVLKYTVTIFAIHYILHFCTESNKNTLLSYVNGLQTKCFWVIVFKSISMPLLSMTNHVMHTGDACNNMQQHVKLFHPF